MELNKKYVVTSQDIRKVMFEVNEFVTLLEKFRTFNVNKNYTVNVTKDDNGYTALMTVLDEK